MKPADVDILLQEYEAKFAATFHGSPDAMVINRTRDGLIVDVNEAYERFFGYPRCELIGHTAVELGLIADPPMRAVFVERLLREGKVQDMPWRSRTKTGEVREALQSGYLVHIGGETHHVAILRDMTASRQRERALRDSEAKFSAVFHVNVDAMRISRLPDGTILDVNEAYERMTGLPRAQLVGRLASTLGIGDDLEECSEMAHIDGERRERTVTIRTAQGERRCLQTVYPIEIGEMTACVSVLRDVTEAQRAEQELRIAATAFESREGMIITDQDGVIVKVNQAFQDMTGYGAAETVGHKPTMLRSTRQDDRFYEDMWRTLAATGLWQGEIWSRRKNAEDFTAWLSITAVRGAQGEVTHYVAGFSDISRQKAAEEEIRNLAFFDVLTRLPNRRFLMERLQRTLSASARSGSFGALLFIDLDHFKNLNDTRGHAVGDRLLLDVAARLQAAMRASDIVARLGGDEFVVVLDELGHTQEHAANAAESVGNKVLSALRPPYSLNGQETLISASIGICIFRGDRDDLEELLKRADTAMYQAKKAGRNTLRLFDPMMQLALQERALIEDLLRRALVEGQFDLHYQVQVDEGGRVLAVEALLRWHHPEHGMISPVRFIPVAEETGWIHAIGEWVMDTACARLRDWQSKPHLKDVAIAVNVSASQFTQPGFVERVRKAVTRHGVDPSLLKLELTESLLVQNIDDTILKMQALKAFGIRFSMDDFGTGHSSLNYLKRLPLDQLKIDRSFVRDIASDPNDAVIVRTIISMGRTLGMNVIAEGVENATQLALLREFGCHVYQGYLFGRPVPAAELEAAVVAMSMQGRGGGRGGIDIDPGA